MIHLSIHGNPITKARPRLCKNGCVYDSQNAEKEKVRVLMLQEIRDKRILRRLQSQISVEMTFHTPVPASWSKKRRESVLGKGDTRRRDLDNYFKFYSDVMNDLLYDDDSQITEMWCTKIYSDDPRVEIFINEID